MVGPGRPLFVLFGSSIVEFSYGNGGWGAILADYYARKADILVRGYAGWNSRRAVQVLDKIFPKNAAIQPALVIVYFGGNDSCIPHASIKGPHVPLQEYIANMEKIAVHLMGLSEKTRIIFLSCPPVNEEMHRLTQDSKLCVTNRSNESCKKYSEACKQLCWRMDLKVIDLFTIIQEHDDQSTPCFIEDGIHFSAEGSKVLAREILKAIRNADWKPTLYCNAMLPEFAEDSDYDSE
ncbi:GDSL esterase/lipase CPRD49-like [Zingiber officinale]|uniref:GDSL esterase/lipase CPRD49-like n=1 Tax=Zingiber officinale TaxID=94328 RepID=UPI001C4D9C9A|nr:GDSL esterase/lipase CPRD49-like [Zingiber officinale]